MQARLLPQAAALSCRRCLRSWEKPNPWKKLAQLLVEDVGCHRRAGTRWCVYPQDFGCQQCDVVCVKCNPRGFDTYAQRGEAWECQLGYTGTTGKLKFLMGNFSATVTLESLISKQTKIPNKKMFFTSEGPHGFQVLKPVQKMLQVFCLCFCL